jgi:TonB-dependent SusC/RagA subfamily outer membrane receptor
MSRRAIPVRALLILGLLLGPVSACIRTSSTTPPETADSPEPDSTESAAAPADPVVDTNMAPIVTAEDIQRSPNEPVGNLLAGRFPGVTVTQGRDGSLMIRIRGTTSIHGSKEPLYVIDGVAVNPGPTGGLHGIQISEIESIEVLKDPVGTSMYGMRGANGVIVITLKKPGR